MSNILSLKGVKFLAIIVLAVAILATFGMIAVQSASADCTITSTLRQGSSGSEVSCLQGKVGATADGKFGPLTKAKVQAFQTANGLTADGIVGPVTRGALSGVMAPAGGTGALCPNGNTLASNCATAPGVVAPVTLCPNGNTLASNCATAPGTTVTGSGEGSVTVTFAASPANNTPHNRGEEKDVEGIEIKAVGADMTVSRVWFDINTRIWLSAESISLKDGSTVLATIPLSASTVEETTVGSAWQIQFNGLNVVVPKGATKVLTVSIKRPTATAANAAVTVAATSTIRAVDQAGISATYTMSARTWAMTDAAAATGTMTNTLSASSPIAQSVSGLSTTAGVTTPVKLMDFDLKALTGLVNVTSISGTLAVTGSTCAVAECVSTVELRDGSTVLASVTGAATLSFGDLDIDVPAGSTKTLSLWGIMNHIASSYVVIGDQVTAAIINTVGTSGPTFAAANTTTDVTGNAQYLYQYAPTFTLVNTATYPTEVAQLDESTSGGSVKSARAKISFSVTAPAGNDIFVDMASTTQVQNYAASPSIPGISKFDTTYGGTLGQQSYVVSGISSKGAVATTYDKVAAGQTRTFTIIAKIPHGGTAGPVGMRVAAIKWTATDHATTGAQIQTWGISDLKTGTELVTD